MLKGQTRWSIDALPEVETEAQRIAHVCPADMSENNPGWHTVYTTRMCRARTVGVEHVGLWAIQ